jgi:hypothetical protein
MVKKVNAVAIKGGFTVYGKSDSNMGGKAFDLYDTEGVKKPFLTPKRSKFRPKGIDPANPQMNFVKKHYDNKGDPDGFYEYMYGSVFAGDGTDEVRKKPSGYRANFHKRDGKLRLSGAKNAHRLGKSR